jgi:hypothetical protein
MIANRHALHWFHFGYVSFVERLSVYDNATYNTTLPLYLFLHNCWQFYTLIDFHFKMVSHRAFTLQSKASVLLISSLHFTINLLTLVNVDSSSEHFSIGLGSLFGHFHEVCNMAYYFWSGSSSSITYKCLQLFIVCIKDRLAPKEGTYAAVSLNERDWYSAFL